MGKAIVPGSFDPITLGHIDIIERASRLYDNVIVAVARNSSKLPLFAVHERIEMIVQSTKHLQNIVIDTFDGLLVHYAEQAGASSIVKGLRAVSDFEYELQMALMNRNLDRNIETVFLMTGAEYSYLSSSIVKEISRMGGSVEGLVTEDVRKRLQEKFSKQS